MFRRLIDNIFIVDLFGSFMQLRSAIEKRKSVSRFHHKSPSWRKIIQAIDAARFAPSAGGLFAMKFILVSEEDKIAKLAEAAQQDFVGTAKYVVVAVSDDGKLERSYGNKGRDYALVQSGAAIENFLLAATELKLATTWVGHFYEEQVKDTLEIADKLRVVAIFPIGLDTKIATREKTKTKLENMIYFDKWGNKKMGGQTNVSVEAV